MKAIINRIIKFFGLVLASFNMLMFYSMRPCWSGISKTLGYENSHSALILNLPVIIFAIISVVTITNIVLFIVLRKKNIWNYILLPINVIFLGAIMYIFNEGAKDYLRFIFDNFQSTFLMLLVVGLIIFFIFGYPKTFLKDCKIFKFTLLGLILLGVSANIVNMQINSITYEPVVYCVEDEYQIVFSSRVEAQGWVEIDGKGYYDTYAGSQKSREKVHKISIPMDELNSAKEYQIFTQRYIYRGPFGAIKGNKISKKYPFTPVDTTDGLNYYSFSDIHMDLKGAKNAIKMDPNVELLILNGDIISDVETYYDANYVNKVAFALTKGKIPVVYARGNHEVKGKYSEQLYKFVGSKNEKFYYNFYIDNIYGLVLDIGEDHDDGWWEYYGSDDFDKYRNEQIEYVKNEVLSENYKNYDYRLVVCHVPLPYINTRHNHVEVKKALVNELNKMNIDMCLVGHQHDLFIFEPGLIEPEVSPMKWNQAYGGGNHKGYLLDFNFPTLMISKHGFTQVDETERKNSMVGLTIEVDFTNKKQICYYNNTKLQKIDLVNPWADRSYGDTIEISLETKKFK